MEPRFTFFYNARLVDCDTDTNGALLIDGDKICQIFFENIATENSARSISEANNAFDCKYVDCEGKTLMPSFIDMHVHFRYPGQTQKEDLQSGLNAAVAGGYGLVVLMPNTNPVVSSDELAHSIEEEAAAYNMADVIQTVSITKDFSGTNIEHLPYLKNVPMVTEDGRDVPTSSVMLDAMKHCAAAGIIVGCHSEDTSLAADARELRKVATDLSLEEANKILALAEDVATMRNIEIANLAGCHIHVDHVSTKNSIEAIRRAKANGQNVTCEITPHHFGLDVEDPKNIRYIVNPPIRSKSDRAALLDAIADGTCDVISTDHAPHTLEDKQKGAPGFPGLETAFAVSYTELVDTGRITLRRLSELMSANPAKILGLDEPNSDKLPRGKLKQGFAANLVIVDTDAQYQIDSSQFKTKGKICPFEGKTVKGKVISTWYKGIKKAP